MVELVRLGERFSCGDDHAFMLNDCKYLYNMYRRCGMLSVVSLLICITILIIMHNVLAETMTYFCTNMTCSVGSVDVFLYCCFGKLFK